MEGPVVALSLPAGSRDDVLFEQAARVALATASVGGMITAIELFGGVYLSEDLYSDWTGYRRRMLSDLRRHLVLRAAGAGAAGADRSTIAGWLEELLRDDPCDEGAARLLMRRYLEEGNRTAALRLYRRLVTALKQDLEADPEPETVAMLKVMRHTE
jgi:DNA-binding SARP family transcriptional activator